jgi:hypothetical protein
MTIKSKTRALDNSSGRGVWSLADYASRQWSDHTEYIGTAKIKGTRDVVYQATWMYRVQWQFSSDDPWLLLLPNVV